MRTDDFDRHIMEELSQIPPAELPRFTPWRPAMDRIVVGTALLTFRFQFFYLQYLLPLLGAVLVYLGYRSLRLENRWFRLGWLLSALLLASHMALDVLAATPVMAMLAASPAVDGTLTWLLQGASLLMLLALWRGTRAVFLSSGQKICPVTGWARAFSATCWPWLWHCGTSWSPPLSLACSVSPSPTSGSTMAGPFS